MDVCVLFTRCIIEMYVWKIFGGFVFSDFAYGDRGFSEFQFFQSWASSCIDIDIVDSVVVVITVYSIRL